MSDSVEVTVRLNELCELLHISVHRPRMAVKIRKAKVTVQGEELDAKQATAPAWKLMPAEMASEIDRFNTQVNRLLAQYTQRFRTTAPGADTDDDETPGILIQGLYLVPAEHAETLLRELVNIETAMRDCIRYWMEDSNRFRDAVRIKMKDNYHIVEEYIPDMASVLVSTRIDAVPIPFGCSMSQLRKVGGDSFLAQARERATVMIDQVARQLIAGPRQELADTVTALQDLIVAEGRVTVRSVAPVRRALEKLKMFNFVADDELTAQVTNLTRILDSVTPCEQDVETAQGNGLLAALRMTAVAALDDAKIEAQQEVALPSRAIQIRRRPALAST